MKKLLITLLAALVACGAFAQDSFPDIPANHWAADAVARIADLGIIIGFPDGTFRGNESFTRYQSALVISRTLDVLNANLDALQAMTDEDIASLRNALQELASDVAAQGVRLSAVEAAVAGLSDEVSAAAAASAENAGAIAALSDDVVANSARIDDVEAALDEVPAGLDPVLRDLQNQIASLRVAADTAQAQAESAEALASGAADAANAAAARADENSEAITSINSVLSLLNDDVTDLQNQVRSLADAPPDVPEGLTDDVARNSSDIANIREFVILLRRDQVALRDRVAALEDGDAGQAAAIDDLSSRVASLEDNRITFGGSIDVDYEVSRVIGDPFDVDRAFGVNADRSMGDSLFSSGAEDLNDDDDDDGDFETEVSEVSQDRADIEAEAGDVSLGSELTITLAQDFNGAGSPRALDTFEAVVEVNIEQLDPVRFVTGDGTDTLDDEDADSEGLYVLNLADFTTTFTVGGDAGNLDITFGDDVDVTLTPWLYEHPGEGFHANLGEPPGLDFLNLGLQAGYAAADPDAGSEYDRYVRGTASPELAENVDLFGGVTYAERTANANDKDDVADDNDSTQLLGVDAELGVGPLTVDADFVTNISPTGSTSEVAGAGGILDVTATVDGSALPILDSLSVNYHDISADYTGLYDDTGDLAKDLDQTGINVAASLGLFIADLEGYFEMNDVLTVDGTEMDSRAFGVDATVELFRGFSLGAFFHQAAIDPDGGAGAGEFQTVDDLEDGRIAADNPEVAGDDDGEVPILDDDGFGGTSCEDQGHCDDDNEVQADRDGNRDTGFGVSLSHDGSSDDAIVPNLNLEIAYEQTEADLDTTNISVSGDYTLNVSILELTPYASFESDNDTDIDSDREQEIKVGTGIATQPLDVFFMPSLEGAVNYRTNSHTEVDDSDPNADYTATELQFSVGVTLNEFLFPYTTLSVKYGSWTGTNIQTNPEVLPDDGVPDGDTATDISDGDSNPGSGNPDVEQSVQGWEAELNYRDLVFNYGVFWGEVDGVGASAQSFTIAYEVTF